MTAPATPIDPASGALFDPRRTRGQGSSDVLRSFRTAATLGWKMEANWTDPVLFFIYSVAKPVSAALILVAMIDVIAGGTADREYRGFVVVGSALWSFVISGISGLAWSILDDRERYRMLKYVYFSPSSLVAVLLGRGTARIGVGAMGAVITLALGVVLMGVPFDAITVDWPLLVVVMALGLEAVVVIGMILAAICLQTRQDSWSYPEAVAGALFLISGAVFPLSVLPLAVQALGLANPLTWWLEGVRRALFPTGASAIGGTGSLYTELSGELAPSSTTIVLALLVTGAIATLLTAVAFRWSERRARDRGLIDQTTGS